MLAEADAKLPPLPGGVGNAIMDAFELAPSRLIGDLKRALEAAIERGELEARREDAYYVAYLARHELVPNVAPEQAARADRGRRPIGDERATPTTIEGPHKGVDPDDPIARACSRAATIPTTIRASTATPIPTIPSCTKH